jgi:hypothetical protein
MFSTEINKLNETGSWHNHCKTRNRIRLLNTDCWLVIFLDNKYTEEHLIEKYLHENSLILITETKVNNLSICISIANVHISVYLFSIDVLKFSKKMCIGYFYTVNFLYHTTEYIFKLINLWNKNYLLSFTCFTNKKKYNNYICIHYMCIQHTEKGISKT